MCSACAPFVAAALLLAPGAPPPPPFPAAPALPVPPEAPYGYLWFYGPDGQGGTAKRVEPYCPHEGDIVFFDDMSKFWEFLYWIGHTAPPFHTGIVVKRPDGTPAILESGPDDTLYIYIFEASHRLRSFKGVLQVRRCTRALTPEQSAALWEFAKAQEGKGYAVWRLLLQGTPVKTRGGPLRLSLAKTHFDRQRWLCTEIVVAAAELVGLMDPNVVKATNTYPLDIVDDHMYQLSPTYEEAAYWAPHP
jgi:hypothetical protein